MGGTLYGTTSEGGDSKDATGHGTVFSVTTNGTENVLHSFGLENDGVRPTAPLIDVGGTLYGTTVDGGAYGSGSIFTITTGGAEKVLYSFKGQPDGEAPVAGLVDVGGTLYGTTSAGGAYNRNSSGVYCTAGCGTAYSISTSGNEKVLHSFGNGTDGMGPGALIDVKGTLYGTTGIGGAYPGEGTVFSITTSSTEKVLHSFGGSSDGIFPHGLLNVKGTLYGTTSEGGANSDGTVFALNP